MLGIYKKPTKTGLGRRVPADGKRLKKIQLNRLLFIVISACFLLPPSYPAYAKKSFKEGDAFRIQTSNTRLKSVPKPFGAETLETLERGDAVTFMKQEGSWFKVDYEGTEGFIPKKSMIESKKFKSFSRTAKVSQSDMAAATKGFSPEIERKNRENKNLRYDLMDLAEEKSTVENPLENLKPFRKEGSLGEFQ